MLAVILFRPAPEFEYDCGQPSFVPQMPKSGQPQIPARLHSYEVRMPNLAPVFLWLIRRARLTSKEVGAAFQISDARVRKICERHSNGGERAGISVIEGLEGQLVHRTLIVIPSSEVRIELGIAPEGYDSELPAAELADIAHSEEQIEREVAEYIRQSDVEAGLARMRWHIRRLGRPHSVERIRLLARLRHNSAWLLIHTGRTRSAIDQATRAMLLSAAAFHESEDRISRERMAEAGLTISMAYAMRNQPADSYKVLRMVRQIYDAAGTKPGSEYYRQLGTAFMLMGHDEEVERAFILSGAAMRRSGISDEMVAVLAHRQQNILHRPNWDGALKTMAAARSVLAPHEMAYQTSVHWAAIVGLASGEKKLTEEAIELLGPAPPVAFGHQATIRKLLEVTPSLPLVGMVLKRWTRYMMYANVFQDD